jgi:hypothetical protein
VTFANVFRYKKGMTGSYSRPAMRFAAVRMCVAFLLAFPISNIALAETIRANVSYGCKSLENWYIFTKFIQQGDSLAWQNALLNGECVVLRHGQEVDVTQRSFLFSRVRLPGDSQDWWMSDFDFKSAIELDQAITKFEALTKELERENRQRAK